MFDYIHLIILNSSHLWMAAISSGSFVRLRLGLPHYTLLIKNYSMLWCAYQSMAYRCLDFLLTPCGPSTWESIWSNSSEDLVLSIWEMEWVWKATSSNPALAVYSLSYSVKVPLKKLFALATFTLKENIVKVLNLLREIVLRDLRAVSLSAFDYIQDIKKSRHSTVLRTILKTEIEDTSSSVVHIDNTYIMF